MQKKTADSGSHYANLQTLKKNLSSLLRDFQRNRQWADIGNWLYRLQELLGDKKYKKLPCQTNLAKRLAQCLNPNLPAGVHSTALKVYTTVLKNFDDRINILPLMSIGLFPFFQYSSLQLKVEIVKIFDQYFVRDQQSLQMIVSLMNALLTGLNEKNQELAKKIYILCQKMSKINGRIWVDGAVWVNILRSPKVRIAGFKYFTKVFKDRDKGKANEFSESFRKNSYGQSEPSVKQEPDLDLETLSGKQENKGSQFLLQQLKKFQDAPDTLKHRFPNFSSLVINALLACLQENQPLVKRSALDMMVGYLRLNNSEILSRKDGIILVQAILQIIPLKQYSLTRRIYTYLFDHPNMEGVYQINEKEKQLQIQILKQAILNKLNVESPANNSSQKSLLIIEALILEHNRLAELLLPHISYSCINFIRKKTSKSKQSAKKINDFYFNIINPYKKIFIESVVRKLNKQNDLDSINQIIANIDFYFERIQKTEKKTRRNSSDLTNKVQKTKLVEQKQGEEQQSSNIQYESIVILIIQHILDYLKESQFYYEKSCIQMLDLCNRLYLQIKREKPFEQKHLKCLDQLLESRPSKVIYGCLLTLHPSPRKEFLLPYIDQGALAIVCIRNILNLKLQADQQLKSLFFAMFKLLNCHLWEQKGIQFIKMYTKQYPDHFQKHIDGVEPSQWLIYWRGLNGNVQGGVIKMLRNLSHKSPLLRNLSQTWILTSSQIISKIIDPFYDFMAKQGIARTTEIYQIFRNIFNIQNTEFTTYFFLQKDKYVYPFLKHMFSCLEEDNQDLKSLSIDMMKFLLSHAYSLEQKFDLISLTMPKILESLDDAIKARNYLLEIQLLSYLIAMLRTFPDLQKNQQKKVKINKFVEASDIFSIVVSGMYESTVPYVRTLYIQYLHQACNIVSLIDNKQRLLTSSMINIIFDKLFIMLRQIDINNLEQIIQGKEIGVSKRKKSQNIMASFQQRKVDKNDLNLESKYAQAIQLWNSIKFYTKFSIRTQIKQLPIVNLISIILQSFPFSDLKYSQFNPQQTTKQFEMLQDQVKNVTGLKKEVLQIFEILWQKYQCQIIDFLIQKGDPRILVHANLDPNLVINAVKHGTMIKQIVSHRLTAKLYLPKGTLNYNLEILIKENQVNYFLYLYLTYCNLLLIKNRKISVFMGSVLKLLKIFNDSNHVQTKLWLLEMTYLLSQRIPFKQVHLQNAKLKQDLQDLLKVLLEELVVIAVRGRNFTHKTEIKTGLFNFFSKEEKQEVKYDFVKIFPPTLYVLSEKANKTSFSNQVINVENFTQHFLFSQWLGRSQSDYINYLSISSIKTLISISIATLLNLYENDAYKISLIIKQMLVQLLPLCQKREQENQVYIQLISEYLHEILNQSSLRQQLMKSVRRNIIEIYMGNDFFKCTKKSLNHWKAIIDYSTQFQDLLGELLSKQGLFEGIFIRKAQAMRIKIKSFQRVCFIIYAGRIDKYQNRLWTVLQSLNEVMKEEDPSPALLILILFCIRILFLRLSQTSLTKMFRSLWPGLMTLLVQIFRQQKAKKNANLILTGLKVIELVHALQLQQFHLHQWMFIFDYFGIKIQPIKTQEDKSSMLTPFEFKPYLTSMLPIHQFQCSFIPQPSQLQASSEPLKRKLIVKQSSIDSQQQLRNHAYVLMQYIIDLNQRRAVVKKDQIEDLIEGDFISLDDYIFQLK